MGASLILGRGVIENPKGAVLLNTAGGVDNLKGRSGFEGSRWGSYSGTSNPSDPILQSDGSYRWHAWYNNEYNAPGITEVVKVFKNGEATLSDYESVTVTYRIKDQSPRAYGWAGGMIVFLDENNHAIGATSPTSQGITPGDFGAPSSNPKLAEDAPGCVVSANFVRSGVHDSGWVTVTKPVPPGAVNLVVHVHANNDGNTGAGYNCDVSFYISELSFKLKKNNVWSFGCTKAMQTFTAPATGNYFLEAWGASGGDGANGTTVVPGAKGGYASGFVHLNMGDVLHIAVGEQGQSASYASGVWTDGAGGWNGGGASSTRPATNNIKRGAGGGASHIAKITGTLTDIGESNLDKVLLIAGGGGGSCTVATEEGGEGGGLVGNDSYLKAATNVINRAYGGTQTAGGAGSANTIPGTAGTFGQGGTCYNGVDLYHACGGGGGLYGGGGAADWSGGGGSSYIGGVPTLDANGLKCAPFTLTGIRKGDGLVQISWMSEDGGNDPL